MEAPPREQGSGCRSMGEEPVHIRSELGMVLPEKGRRQPSFFRVPSAERIQTVGGRQNG